MLNVDILIEYARSRNTLIKRNKYENNVKTFVTLRRTRRKKKVHSGSFSSKGKKKENQISILMSFKSMNCSRFFGWFFRDKKVGVPALIARPRLIKNKPSFQWYSTSQRKQELSIAERENRAQDETRQKKNLRYHCCYFCKTAA